MEKEEDRTRKQSDSRGNAGLFEVLIIYVVHKA